jgi:hypothetical protein
VENPDDALYKILRQIYVDYREELKLREAFNPLMMLGGAPGPVDCVATRAILESVDGGSYRMQSSGTVINVAQGLHQIPGQQVAVPMPAIFDQRKQEGRIYEQPN